VALLVAAWSLAGCSRNNGSEPPTQVVAKVNSDEITVHQVNFMLARANASPETEAQVKKEILEKLIRQHLARQKAIENNLDRSPNVMQAIEAARNDILARAYVDQLAGSIPTPAQWEIEKYYREHSELFSERRLFDLEEFVFQVEASLANELRDRLPKMRSMQEIADWLQSRGIQFLANRGLRAGEQIRLEMLPELQKMAAGEIRLFETGTGHAQIIRVVAFKSEPMDETTAAPLIQRFLHMRRSSEYVDREMQRLREQASIQLLGEFATKVDSDQPKSDQGTPPADQGNR
jgi:EpsD family peptidyl-prolyl cis-trans isomerase